VKESKEDLLQALGIGEFSEPGEPISLAPDPICGVCGDLIQGPSTACPQCETPHHAECWQYNEGCTVYGCQGVLAVVQSQLDQGPPLTPEAPIADLDPWNYLASIPASGWSFTGLLLVLLSFGIGSGDIRDLGRVSFFSLFLFVLGNVGLWLSSFIQQVFLWQVNRHKPRRLISFRDSSTKEEETKLARNPKDLDALKTLCLIHFAREEWKQAAMLYERALSMVPDDPNFLFRYGRSLDRLGREEDARKVFSQLLDKHAGHHFAKLAYFWLMRIAKIREERQRKREESVAAGIPMKG
jgi:hypothetical protein